MIVTCVSNRGADLGPHTRGLHYTDRSEFNLAIGSVYAVFGIVLFNAGLTLLLADGHLRPMWAPVELFEVDSPQIPDDWEFAFFRDERSDAVGRRGRQAVWGYHELVHSDEHYEGLVELKLAAIEVFAKRVQRGAPSEA